MRAIAYGLALGAAVRSLGGFAVRRRWEPREALRWASGLALLAGGRAARIGAAAKLATSVAGMTVMHSDEVAFYLMSHALAASLEALQRQGRVPRVPHNAGPAALYTLLAGAIFYYIGFFPEKFRPSYRKFWMAQGRKYGSFFHAGFKDHERRATFLRYDDGQ